MAIRANAKPEGLADYLKQMDEAFPQSVWERLTRANSKPVQGSALPSGIKRGPMGNCFENAITLALEKNWTYCEGFAISILPVHHAWCVDENGQVIDNTWDEPERCVYAGIPMNAKKAFSLMVDRGFFGLFYSKQLLPYATGVKPIEELA